MFVSASAYIDAEHLKDKDWIESHTSRVIQRLVFVLTIALFNIKGAIASGIIMTVLFDQLLNEMRGLPTLHLGTTAKWDRFWRDKIIAYIIFKLVLLATGLTILFI